MSRHYLRQSARALAALGFLALTLSGEIGLGYLVLAWCALVAGLIADQQPDLQIWLRHAETPAVIGLALMVLLDFFLLHLTPFVVLSHFLVLFQSFKLIGPKERKDCFQILIFSFLEILVACTLSIDVSEGFILLWLVPLATVGFFWHQVDQERERFGGEFPLSAQQPYRWATWLLGGAALPIHLILTLLVFIFFPRLTLNVTLPGLGNSNIGYAHQMDLTRTGQLQSSTAPVLWLSFHSEEERALWSGYLRGDTLETFDGRQWTAGADSSGQPLPRDSNNTFRVASPTAAADRLQASIMLVAPSGATLFVPGRPLMITAPLSAVLKGTDGSLHAPTAFHNPIRYGVISEIETPTESAEPMPLCDLELPSVDLTRTRRLTDEIAGAGTPGERAERIESYLRSHYHYSLKLGEAAALNPVDSFLFERRQGPCGYFASAMATMLRLKGIPSRVVAGYLKGEWNAPAGQILIRDRDAHAWVEAFIPSKGWQRYDPSPRDELRESSGGLSPVRWARQHWDYVELQWNRLVIDYDLYTQLRAFERVQASGQPIADRLSRWRARWRTADHSADADISVRVPNFSWWILGVMLLGTLVIFSIVFRRRRMLFNNDMAIREYRQFLSRMARSGIPKGPAETGLEYAARLASRQPAQRSQVTAVTERYYAARFGQLVLAIFLGLTILRTPLARADEGNIKALQSDLKSGDPDKREHAAEALKALGPAAASVIPALRSALNDDMPYVRVRSAEALAAIGPPAVPALIAALSNDSSDIRSIAVITLGRLGEAAHSATPALIKTLKDSDLTVRSNASSALVRFGTNAVPALIPVLKDSSGETRILALRTLGEIRSTDRDLLQALMGSFSDENSQVRLAAVKALGHKGSAAVPVLIEGLRASESTARIQACMVLADLGRKSKDAVPALTDLLKDSDSGVRGWAATALGKIGSASQPAIPQLRQLTKDENVGVASKAREALTNISALFEQKTSDTPQPALQLDSTPDRPSPSKNVAKSAAKKKIVRANGRAMVVAKKPSKVPVTKVSPAIAALIKQLKDIDDVVRLEASQKLVALGPQAVPGLMDAVVRSTVTVRVAATTILGQIGAPAAPALAVLNANLSAPEQELRQPSAIAMLLIDSTTALGLLTEAIRQSTDPAVRRNAIVVLGKVGPPAAPTVPALAAVLKEPDSDLGNAASLTLSQIGTPEALTAVKQYERFSTNKEVQDAIIELRAKSPAIDNKAVEAMIDTGGSGVSTMASALHDTNVTVRIGVARALNRMGHDAAPAVGSLIDALDDSDPIVRKEAAEALAKINTPEAQSALRFLPEKEWLHGMLQRFKK